MHKDFERADKWSYEAIGASIEVHKLKGPGLLEEIYEKCLIQEFLIRKVPVESQIQVAIEYKGITFEQPLKLDIVIDRCLILELKAVERLLPIHKAQLLSYMRLLDAPLGLLINFHEITLKDGIHRMILPGADK